MLANRVRMSRLMGDKFGSPILTEQGVFLDRWTASGTGTGVGQVYNNMLHLTVSDSSVGDTAQFLSDTFKVSSDALTWRTTGTNGLGGVIMGQGTQPRYLHGIPIGMIIRIGITLTCTQAGGRFFPARFELYISFNDEDGEPLAGVPIVAIDGFPTVSIDWLKFT